jgi:hypothetical protein
MTTKLSVRARVLLAFQERGETLTQREIMRRAETTDCSNFRHTKDAGLIEALDWVPNQPRLYQITPTGSERRDSICRAKGLVPDL